MDKGNLVAVYGTLMNGFGNNRILSNSNFLGEDRVEGFKMLDLGWFPGVVSGENNIRIEVFEVDSKETAMRLDALESYPRMYDRKLIDTKYGKAWIYTFNTNNENEDSIEEVVNGDWKDYSQKKEH